MFTRYATHDTVTHRSLCVMIAWMSSRVGGAVQSVRTRVMFFESYKNVHCSSDCGSRTISTFILRQCYTDNMSELSAFQNRYFPITRTLSNGYNGHDYDVAPEEIQTVKYAILRSRSAGQKAIVAEVANASPMRLCAAMCGGVVSYHSPFRSRRTGAGPR